jgi:hypothetical protein
MRRRPAGEATWARSAEESALATLAGRRAELAALGPAPARDEDPGPAEPRRRLEAALIEVLVTREVAAARLDSSEPIYAALGPFPAGEPAKALAWGRGANAIARYRARHGERDPEQALGGRPRSPEARAEREQARRAVEAARRELGRRHTRAAERDAAQEMSIGR